MIFPKNVRIGFHWHEKLAVAEEWGQDFRVKFEVVMVFMAKRVVTCGIGRKFDIVRVLKIRY